MTAQDIGLFVAGLALFIGLLAVLAAVADGWDRRRTSDSRRRNPYPQRTRDHARRMR